jgi:hypothetical protein
MFLNCYAALFLPPNEFRNSILGRLLSFECQILHLIWMSEGKQLESIIDFRGKQVIKVANLTVIAKVQFYSVMKVQNH